METPKCTAAAGLDLTRDVGAAGTRRYVLDRITGTMHVLAQREFEPGVQFDSSRHTAHNTRQEVPPVTHHAAAPRGPSQDRAWRRPRLRA